jgi:hypothetical protein
MDKVLALFREEGTVDELGIGSIRDAIADILFPGTSVLHTRARYQLFIPWLLNEADARSATAATAANGVSELRRVEVKLIHALLKGEDNDGIIGRVAKDKLKRMPSAAYWAALNRFGIRTWDTTIEGFFRSRKAASRQSSALDVDSDDPNALSGERRSGLHPDLPTAPPDLLSQADFKLTAAEADFLHDVLITSTQGSLLAWLLANSDGTWSEWIWEHPQLGDFPPTLAGVVDHGRRFSLAIHGAALLYNLLLAQKQESPELTTRYEDALDDWATDVREARVFDGWDHRQLWDVLADHRRPVSPLTKRFADAWLDLARSDVRLAGDTTARNLVSERERHLKGGRARLVNAGALDVWRGASGLVRLDYRWGVTYGLLADIVGADVAAEV